MMYLKPNDTAQFFRWATMFAAGSALAIASCGGSDSPDPVMGHGGTADASIDNSTTGGAAGSLAKGGSAGAGQGGGGGSSVGGTGGNSAGGSGGGLPDAGAGGDAALDDAADVGSEADATEAGPWKCTQNSECDDSISCTVDTCAGGTCYHWPGPNSGSTACPSAKMCDVTQGCVSAPICATKAQCEAQWAADPCKASVQCDSASSTCTFTALDKDNDGHPPLVCGGDDCDDGVATVHPGEAESCDGKDNDCNGQVDDGTCTPHPGDDPCPSDPMYLNCSDSCGPTSANCALVECVDLSHVPEADVTDKTLLPLTLRTPSHPGMNSSCKALCQNYGVNAIPAMQFGVHMFTDAVGLTIKVDPPWVISNSIPGCMMPQVKSGCMAIGAGDSVVNIITADPDAPARNVTIEETPWPGNCP